MKVKNVESGLAWVGALVVLIGVSFAAGNAFGAEPAPNYDAVSSTSEVAAVAVSGARDANTQSAAAAAAAIAHSTALGLEIELVDQTSTLIANARYAFANFTGALRARRFSPPLIASHAAPVWLKRISA